MDNSQNSDVFSTSIDIFNSPSTIDSVSYESLLSKLKEILLCNAVENEFKKSTFSLKFTSLIGDCNTCISQSFDLVVNLLEDTNTQLKTFSEYIEDAVCLVQMLYNFIKNVGESVTMRCVSMKTFPTAVGHIILTVFTHCKDSESLYGSHLYRVERQLKELFRSCHELQLTYLMIMEKHFIFDLSHRKELDILIEALDINLQIGDVVQTLDVKTMAEQWKAYTRICEKYSTHLMNNILGKSINIICTITENNIRTAREASQDDKIIVRSLKVASFTIKILMKICNVFKNALSNNYKRVVELFLYIYTHSCDTLGLNSEKSITNLTKTNILSPSESLLSELLLHENFLLCIVQYDTRNLKNEEKILGYVLLIVSVMQCSLQRWDDQPTLHVYKLKLLNCIFSHLEYCHPWFSTGMKFNSSTEQSYGLYEHLLAHAVALSATLNSDQYIELEWNMYESLLGVECWKALFASDLWVSLAGHGNRQLLYSQVIALCSIYKKLQNVLLFRNSPQNTHIGYTLRRLFEAMPNEDKIRVHKQFDIFTEDNIHLYITLKIKNLPENIRCNTEKMAMEKLNADFFKLVTLGFHSAEEIDDLNKKMRLVATCSSPHTEHSIKEYIMKAWEKACPKNCNFIPFKKHMHAGNMWYFDYVNALTQLTNASDAYDMESLVKVLHVLTNIVQIGNTELKLTLINLLCKLSCHQIDDQNKQLTYPFLVQCYKNLFQETDELLRNKLCDTLKLHLHNKNLKSVISKILNEESSLDGTWKRLLNDETINHTDWMGQYFTVIDFKYVHKCIKCEEVTELTDSGYLKKGKKSHSNNFDLADIDTLFENENICEPAYKKPKVTIAQVENIISRMEEDVAMLSKIKENVSMSNYRNRVMGVRDKLQNIIS